MMTGSEKLGLNWNDFKENVISSFGSLRGDNDLSDVTLACEDGHQLEAHKVILASSSPFFMDILKEHKHSHPLIYMKGLNSTDMSAMLDFLYFGEANVYQENLDTFLALAEELKLKGLTGTAENKMVEDSEDQLHTAVFLPKNENSSQQKGSWSRNQQKASSQSVKAFEMAVSLPNSSTQSEDIGELEEQINSMIEYGEHRIMVGKELRKAAICKVCGKEGKRVHMREHIEINHITGFSHSCNTCGKTFRSRSILRKHKSSEHHI